MNTVLTIKDLPAEWFQDTYICLECEQEFMMKNHGIPLFCPCCGVQFDVLRTKHKKEAGGGMKTTYLNPPDVIDYYEDETEEDVNEDVHQD